MILRRPSQADKEAILDMMGEFEREKSVHDGGFWNTDNFIYEEWLEENLQSEAGLNKLGSCYTAGQFQRIRSCSWFSTSSSSFKWALTRKRWSYWLLHPSI